MQLMDEAERVVQELDRTDAYRAAAAPAAAPGNGVKAVAFDLANKVFVIIQRMIAKVYLTNESELFLVE